MSSYTGKLKTIYKVTNSKMVLRTGFKPVTVPERNQRTPKGESPNKRLARKHTNMIITLANNIHTMTKHHMSETCSAKDAVHNCCQRKGHSSLHC